MLADKTSNYYGVTISRTFSRAHFNSSLRMQVSAIGRAGEEQIRICAIASI